MTPGQLRVARYKVATRIHALSKCDALSLGDTVHQLLLARRPPDEMLDLRARRIAQSRQRTQERLDKLYAQVRQAQGELAEIVAQEVKNDALRARVPEDPYVCGLWTELRLQFACETGAIAKALARWRAIEATLDLERV